MPSDLLILLVIGGVILLILWIEPVRKFAIILVLLAAAFAIGRYWPRSQTYPPSINAISPPPCVSSY